MKKWLRITLIFGLLMSFISCGGKYTSAEMREIVEPLIEASEILNVVYFGEGLPVSVDEDEAEAFYSSFDTDVESLNYHPVAEDSAYTTEAEIREDTLAVFTEEYSKFLFDRAFVGVSDTYDNGEGEVTQTAVYARYIERNGRLTVRLKLSEEAYELGRVYDFSTLKIVQERKNYVIVEIETELGGVISPVELKVVLTEDGWRLDSPTY